MKVVLPHWEKLINPTFIPLVENTDRYLILKGGRGSSKSDFAAKKLIKRCLSEKYFRYVLYRKTYNTIKDSQYQNIKDIIEDWGIASLFAFTENPLSIKCTNGNRFICRGGDDPKRLKSIKDPTGVWYEEEIPEEGDFITITTSIRTTKADYLQEIFSINPEVEGDYKEHWFWRRFFGEEIAEGVWEPKYEDGTTYSDTTQVRMPDDMMFGATFTVHHSTYKDNRWIPDSFIAQLLDLARTNPYYYTVYALGLWGNKISGGNFYKLFERSRIVKTCTYNPALPLHLTFDFNVHPYVTLNVHQIQQINNLGIKYKCRQIDEICLPTPRNRTESACTEFKNRYRSHGAGVFVYGDPAGKHEDTRTEQGYNDFSIIAKELTSYRPQQRYKASAPPVAMRGLFINAIFDKEFGGISIEIDPKCTQTVADYTNLKEAADGTKAKLKVKNNDTGVIYEKYGHTSDANDYFYCAAFSTEFIHYQRGGAPTQIRMGNAPMSKNNY